MNMLPGDEKLVRWAIHNIGLLNWLAGPHGLLHRCFAFVEYCHPWSPKLAMTPPPPSPHLLEALIFLLGRLALRTSILLLQAMDSWFAANMIYSLSGSKAAAASRSVPHSIAYSYKIIKMSSKKKKRSFRRFYLRRYELTIPDHTNLK